MDHFSIYLVSVKVSPDYNIKNWNLEIRNMQKCIFPNQISKGPFTVAIVNAGNYDPVPSSPHKASQAHQRKHIQKIKQNHMKKIISSHMNNASVSALHVIFVFCMCFFLDVLGNLLSGI